MATFETFALQCATGVALDLLAAIASVESGMRPLAVRDGDKIALVQSAGEGVAAVAGVTDQGREPGIGLMGVTPRQLRAAGMALQDGFDPCNALKAAAMVFSAARANAISRGYAETTGDRVAVRMWWRPESRFASAAALEAAVTLERAQAATLLKRDLADALPQSAPSKPSNPLTVATAPRAPPHAALTPDCWDIFARQRAGLSQCDAPTVPPTSAEQTRPALLRPPVASPPTER